MGSIEQPRIKNHVTFYVNGQSQTVKDEYPLETTLSYYLRDVLNLTGTKVSCGEGGCGSCAVNASIPDPTDNTKTKTFSINSCIFPLYGCDGYSFTTVEGLGNRKVGANPIQKRLADANASQCGYCTPGFVMSMYSLLKNNPRPSKQDIEKSFDGNICRCTGYRAILDSMKTFAADESPIQDIEDLMQIKCFNNNNNNNDCCHETTTNGSSCDIVRGVRGWHAPTSLTELIAAVKRAKDTNKRFKLVNGNTATGVYKSDESNSNFDSLISVRHVHELTRIERSHEKLTIGSAVTLTDVIKTFEEAAQHDTAGFKHLAKSADDLRRVASGHVRNAASWSGNLALKRLHAEFPSDVLVLLESIGATLTVYDLTSDSKSPRILDSLGLVEYVESERTTKLGAHIIESMSVPALDQSRTRTAFFKTAHRAQNSHSYVNAGFRFELESGLRLASTPVIILNGLAESFNRATKTEQFLAGKSLDDESVLKEAIKTLESEINSSGIVDGDPLLPSAKYRTNLACSYLYKFVVSLLADLSSVSGEYRSAAESVVDSRDVTRSEQKFPRKESQFPLTQPVAKLNAVAQTTGETKYAGDLRGEAREQLYGVFVKSTVASATIESVDVSAALRSPGVVRVFLAKDIPGENNIMNNILSVQPEVLFADGRVDFYGQPIGLVVGKSEAEAQTGAHAVKVNYTNVSKPILTIEQAIENKSLHAHPLVADHAKGDPETAIKNSKHQIKGEFRVDSMQYNFFIEGLVGVCEPTEDGYRVECCTQWIDSVQSSVANVLGIKNSSCIDVQVKQIGGGFGGKTTRTNIPASAAALASFHLNTRVKIAMTLNDCMDILGRRPTWLVKYSAGFDDQGKLNGVDYEWQSEAGSVPNGSLLCFCHEYFESAYKCENIRVKETLYKTNKPGCVEVRSPDILTSYFVTENLMQHVAEHLGRDPLEVRELNLLHNGDTNISGRQMKDMQIETILSELKQSSEYASRKLKVDEFNKQNKYKKRGISLIPMKYGLTHMFSYYNAIVSIRHDDGSVSISHGGIEMGQGVHTKAAQVCAHLLGIPLDLVSVKSTNNLVNPNGNFSGGSITSELVVKSVIGACEILNKTLEPLRATMETPNYTWKDLVGKAYAQKLNLSAMYLARPPEGATSLILYDVEAAACSEVLVDVLTGEVQVVRTDILFDCGQTMNGLIDLGQAEGGFLMGLGYALLEKSVYDPETGLCLNNGTWEYKPPMAGDIPVDFRVKLADNKVNELGVLGSKGVGEPPLILSNSVVHAIRHAVRAAREDRGVRGHFVLNLPATVDNVQAACLVEPAAEFRFK